MANTSIKYYPMFDHPVHGSVGHFLCDKCAGGRMIRHEQSIITKCDNCEKDKEEQA